ncbi:MAG: PAS domain S-box protein [Candidatus Omnitrophica bacterium]|nr:PAS domain S-box protein [Candidatus Omnitrophota bacterium]
MEGELHTNIKVESPVTKARGFESHPSERDNSSLLKRPCPIGEFVSLITPDYRYASVNNGLAEAQGKTIEALTGMPLREVWGETVFEGIIKEHLDACLADEVVHYQSWFDFPNTGRRYWEVSYYPYREDAKNISHAMVVTRDMTEQQRSRELLDLESGVLELIAKGVHPRGTLSLLQEKVTQILPGIFFFIRVVNRKNGHLETFLHPPHLDLDSPFLKPFKPSQDSGVCGAAVYHGTAVAMENLEGQNWKANQVAGPETPIERALAIPFRGSKEKVLGVASFYYPPDKFYESAQLEVLEFASRLAGLAIDQFYAEQQRIRLETAIEQAGESIIITDADGIIQYVNPAFESCSGYTREEVLQKPVSTLDRDEDGESFRQLVFEELRHGNLWSGRFQTRRKDGSLFETEATVTPVRDTDGEIVSWVSVQRDVTHQANLENQLRHAQKMEAVGQLAGGVAHDFNNILQAIYGASEMALSGLDESSQAGQDIEDVIKSADRGSELIRQLLAFSRRNVYKPQPVNLNSLVDEMLKMLDRILGENIEITFLPQPDLAELWGDSGQIEQILLNLVMNARDSMPDGGRIAIQTVVTSPPLGPQYYPSEPERKNYVRMSLSDTGTGIPEEVKDRIFEPFFTTKEVGKGTGLGLSIVFGILKQHQGFVHFESRKGRGTRFDLYFPLADQAASDPKGPVAPKTPRSGNDELILLAEDNDQIREVTATMLRRAGYRVIEASDGVEAIRLFERHMLDTALAFLDVRMPNESGKAVYEAIRRVRSELPVVFATGFSADILGNCAEVDPLVQVLPKPFRESELLEKVARGLRMLS